MSDQSVRGQFKLGWQTGLAMKTRRFPVFALKATFTCQMAAFGALLRLQSELVALDTLEHLGYPVRAGAQLQQILPLPFQCELHL